MEETGKKIVKLCQGLPLAITVVASLLRTKKLEDWDEVLRDMHGVQNHEMNINGILALSYDRLHHYLKSCLLYLGQFPPDQRILVEKLYLLWVAEGLISGGMDAVQELLDNLATRNLVNLRTEEDVGTLVINSCEIHDLIRDFCIMKGKEEDFYEIVDLRGGNQISCSIRRVAIYMTKHLDGNDMFSYIPEAKNIRSLLFFGKDESQMAEIWPKEVAELKDFLCTRVLDFDGINFLSNKLPEGIDKLIYLRYLGFGGCYLEELPLSCCNFPYLETLYLLVQDSCIMTIPDALWKLSNLRNLYFPVAYRSATHSKLKLNGLTRLEVLENFNAGTCDAADLLQLKHLKVFTGIADGNTMDFKTVIDFLGGRECLRKSSFIFKGFDCYSKVRRSLVKELLKCDVLHSLHLEGHLKKVSTDLVISQNFTVIIFDGSEFHEDPIPMLGKLQHLRSLVLCNDAIVCNKLDCSNPGFSQLRSFKLANLQFLEEWLLEAEGMPFLSVVTIEHCDKLMLPSELGEIDTLEELKIGSMPKAFELEVRKMAEEQMEMGNDTLSITFYDC